MGSASDDARHGPRIAVIGNCQAIGVARALEALLPQARVETLVVAFLGRRFDGLDALARHLAPCDLVACHYFPEGFLRGGDAHALGRRVPALRLFPTIAFPGFHPDMVYLGDLASLRLSRLVEGPLGPAHSAIALWGYLEGLSAAATLRLYHDEAFAQLGYYDLWQAGTADLLSVATAMGFPLERDLPRWARRGCFMHDFNHPKLHVLGDLARRLAVEAGLSPLDLAAEHYIADPLIGEAMWPVYPAVAERYGVPETPLFRGRLRPGQPPRLLDLPGFVAESHARYAALPREALVCPRVEGWRANAALRALAASARRP